MIKIFVSHAWADKVKSQFGQLYEELNGYDLWIDKTGLTPGSSINEGVIDAIKESEIFLLMWSENAAKSESVLFEIQSAAGMNKIIVPCAIDNYPIEHSEYLIGKLFIDLRSEGAGQVIGWMKLRYFLTDYFIEKTSKKIANYDDEELKLKVTEMLKGLKSSQVKIKRQIADLEDTSFRITADAEDRNKNNPYSRKMMDTLIDQLGNESATLPEKQIAAYLAEAKKILENLPGDDADTVKQRNALMLAKILQLDPSGQNEKLIMFRDFLIREI